MARNIDRFSTTAQLAKTFSDLESAKAEHARQALRLAQNPKDADTLEQVAQLELEIHNHRVNIRRLEAAQEAANLQVTAEEQADRGHQIQHLRGKVADTSNQLEPLLSRMIERIESVGPDLAQFVALAAQRREAANAAVRMAGGSKALQTVFANAMRIDGHDVLVEALIGAVVRSGIGQVGPSLSPYIVLDVPGVVPTVAHAERGLQRDRDRLLEAIDRAVNPQPATMEE